VAVELWAASTALMNKLQLLERNLKVRKTFAILVSVPDLGLGGIAPI